VAQVPDQISARVLNNSHLMRKLFHGPCAVCRAADCRAAYTPSTSHQNIMRGPELYGRHPDTSIERGQQWIYFTWLEPAPTGVRYRTIRVRAIPGSRPNESRFNRPTRPLSIRAERTIHNGRYSAVEFNGDIYVNASPPARSGASPRRRSRAQSAVLGQRPEIFFVRNNNIYRSTCRRGSCAR